MAGGSTFNKALAQNVAAEKVQMYGQAFEKIQAATGIEDIDVLVNSFISAGEGGAGAQGQAVTRR
jgi:hypothetical protein